MSVYKYLHVWRQIYGTCSWETGDSESKSLTGAMNGIGEVEFYTTFQTSSFNHLK